MSELIAEKTNDDFCKTSAVSNWLAERSEMLIQYFRLSGARDSLELPESQQITQFCDLLIDYVSAGHFEVYQQIVNACEINGTDSIQLLSKLYPEISETTDEVVSFNDKYSKFSKDANLSELDKDLSKLGEAIAKRIELEDTLRTKH
jgi:regulator of sigma D